MSFWNAVREIGCSDNTLHQILKGNHERVQKQTAARIILVLQYLRKNGIMYHKKDIQVGVHRVKKLRQVKRPQDQYGPVYPELEDEYRAKEAARKREERKRLKEAKEFQQSQEQRLQDLTGY